MLCLLYIPVLTLTVVRRWVKTYSVSVSFTVEFIPWATGGLALVKKSPVKPVNNSNLSYGDSLVSSTFHTMFNVCTPELSSVALQVDIRGHLAAFNWIYGRIYGRIGFMAECTRAQDEIFPN